MTALLLIQVLTTVFMTGLIWLVQCVHYPLFAAVGREQYIDYQEHHVRRISWIVMPVMLAELVSAALLWLWAPTAWAPYTSLGLLLLGLIWLSTALLQVPCHNLLSDGFQPEAHRRLVTTNWLRTAAWTARTGVLLGLLNDILKQTALSQ